jgi:hypothetical protein
LREVQGRIVCTDNLLNFSEQHWNSMTTRKQRDGKKQWIALFDNACGPERFSLHIAAPMEINLTYPESLPHWLQNTLSITILVVGLCLVLFSCRWVGRDADRRGKSGCLVAILVLLTWPLGLLLWLFFRPDSRSKWSRF